MKRLTTRIGKKDTSKFDYYIRNDECECEERGHLERVYEKLGKLEDLEEQIGMPLDVFASILNKRIDIWVINGNNIISYCIDGIKNGIFYYKDYCRGCRMDDILFNPADYGIVWFLTREEAEKKLEEMKNEK